MPRLVQTTHLYLGIYVTRSQPINLPATSQNKAFGVGGGRGAHFHCVVVYALGWGMGGDT